MKKAPEVALHTTIAHTQGQKAREQGKHVPEVGLEPGANP
ncbi:hypothetical protein QF036_002367 [Arthrobacter globiformis]|nr:hypothetical protein [Arthrobacter globiformis]